MENQLLKKVNVTYRLPNKSHRYNREGFFTNKGWSIYDYEKKEFNKEGVEWFYEPLQFNNFEVRAEKYFYNQTLDEKRIRDMKLGASFIIRQIQGD